MKTALPLLTFALLVSCQPKKIVSDDPAPEEKAAAEEKVAAITLDGDGNPTGLKPVSDL